MELAQDLSYWLCFKIENFVIREFIIHLDEYLLLGKGGRSVGLTNLTPSFAEYLEILGAPISCSSEGQSRPEIG